MKKFLGLVAGALLAAGSLALPAAAEVTVGQPFPEVSLPSVDGPTVKFNAELFGKNSKTALVFFNTSCAACRQELTLVNKMAGKNKGLKVYAVSIDMAGKPVVEVYKKQLEFALEYLLDPEFTVGPKFGLNYTPALVVVDKAGKVSGISSGFTAGRDDDKIIKLLE